jgi:hypothetical protein
MYTIYKIGPNLYLTTLYQLIEECEESHWAYIACKDTNYEVFSARYQLNNDGLTSVSNIPLDFTVPINLNVQEVSVQSSYSSLYFFTDTKLSPVNVNQVSITGGTTNQFLVSSLGTKSIVYIAISALYTKGSSASSVTLNTENYYSFNSEQTITNSIVNMGGVTGFQPTPEPVPEGPNPHEHSIIMVIVYFSGLGLTLITIGIGHLLGILLKSTEVQ